MEPGSRRRLLVFSVVAAVKHRTRWASRRTVVRTRIGGRVFGIHLAGRSDLEVLREIVIEGEYDDSPQCKYGVIVDAGANIGLATLRLVASNPATRVIAIEADPLLIPQLRANTAGLPVTIVNAALGDRCEPRTLYRSTARAWGNALVRTGPDQVAVTVPGVTFNRLLAEHGVDEVGLLKLDVEGAEWQTFPQGLPENVVAAVVELHRVDRGLVADDAVRFAAGMRVKVVREDPDRVVFLGTR